MRDRLPSLLRSVRLSLALAVGLAGAAPAAESEVSVSTASARLAVMQLATGVDADVSAIVEGAPDLRAIYMHSGDTDLSGLLEAVKASETPGALERRDGTVVAHLPIVVLQGASLALPEGSRLTFDRPGGAFLLSLGRVSVTGAEVGVTGGRHAAIDGFRPFLAGVGQQSLSVRDSTLAGLGFGKAPFSAGVFLGGKGLLSGGKPEPIAGNTFRDLRGIAASGVDDLAIRGNRFADSRGAALRRIDGSGGAVADNTIRGTGGNYAMRLSGTSDLTVTGNTLSGGKGKGLRIDDQARRLALRENSITGFGGTGVTLAEGAACILLENNTIARNAGTGLAARGTGALIAARNTITDNEGAGIAIRRQRPDTSALLIRNTLADNRRGIRGTSLERLRLAHNDLSDQRPRLLSGDLDQITPDYLRAARGAAEPDIIVETVDAREAQALRRDAAQRAFEECGKGGLS